MSLMVYAYVIVTLIGHVSQTNLAMITVLSHSRKTFHGKNDQTMSGGCRITLTTYLVFALQGTGVYG